MKKPAPNARKPLQREAVDDRAHAVLADAEVEVAARVVRRVSTLPPPLISVSVRRREVGGAADQLRHLRGRPLDDVLGRLAGGDHAGVRALLGDVGVPALGQLAARAALELARPAPGTRAR